MLRDGSVGVETTWCGVDGDVGRVERETSRAERQAPDEERCEQLHRKLKRIVKARAALDALKGVREGAPRAALKFKHTLYIPLGLNCARHFMLHMLSFSAPHAHRSVTD